MVGWDEVARLASAPVTVTLRGRVRSTDDAPERLTYAPPDFWRVEDDDGRLRYLANDTGHHERDPPGAEPARVTPRRRGHWTSGGAHLPPETFAAPAARS